MTFRHALAAFALAAATSAAAAPIPTGADLARAGWMLWTLDRVPATKFVGSDAGRIDVTADGAFGLLYRPVPAEDRDKMRLTWRWRVDATIPPADLARPGADDRPIAVHVWFPDTESGFIRRLARSIALSFAGVPVSGKVITYVWGGEVPRGTLLPNPHIEGDGVLIVLRGARDPLGQWMAEDVDLAADFERAFGRKPRPPTHVALSADTDDGGGRVAAAVADLGFAP